MFLGVLNVPLTYLIIFLKTFYEDLNEDKYEFDQEFGVCWRTYLPYFIYDLEDLNKYEFDGFYGVPINLYVYP